ncbi:MAG: Smr/MutS family protein [Deltaproteobacteria bacterium]
MKKKVNGLFNPAFEGLKKKIGQAQEKPEAPLKEEAKKSGLEDEMVFFLDAMSGVTPMPEDRRRSVQGSTSSAKPSRPPTDESRLIMEHLQGLVTGSVELDITFSDEYIEGAVQGFNRKLMKKLKRGELPVQGHIDLHGLTKQDAETAVTDFLLDSFRNGMRCVLIVHGRGLNSPESLPVLKEGLPQWLNRGRVRKVVLAFATARPYDGGTGATYVFLRKR